MPSVLVMPLWAPPSSRDGNSAQLRPSPASDRDEQVNSLFSQLSEAESMTEVSDHEDLRGFQPVDPFSQESTSRRRGKRHPRRKGAARTWTNPIAEDRNLGNANPFYGDVHSSDSCDLRLRACKDDATYEPLTSRLTAPPDLAAQLEHPDCASPTHRSRTDESTAGGVVTSFKTHSHMHTRPSEIRPLVEDEAPGCSNSFAGTSNRLDAAPSLEFLRIQNETLRKRIAAMEAILNNNTIPAAPHIGGPTPTQSKHALGVGVQPHMRPFTQPMHMSPAMMGMTRMVPMTCNSSFMRGANLSCFCSNGA
jgi:hypothetical protein